MVEKPTYRSRSLLLTIFIMAAIEAIVIWKIL